MLMNTCIPILSAVASLLAIAPGAIATPLDLSNPEDALTAFRKITCSLEDGQPTYFVWQGKIYSRIPGEPDRHLFNVQGMNARTCVSLTSETGAAGFRQLSREVMLYLDPDSNEILETWENPWTQKTNTVMAVANDPVNSRPFWVDTTGETLDFQQFGDRDLLFLKFTILLFYPNPLGNAYQNYTGGQYHAMEMFNFAVPRRELETSALSNPSVALSWSRISPWLPWMAMGNRPGELVFHAAGTRVGSWQDVPEPLRESIAAGPFALYQTPPPLDDDRPNETTWTNFRDYLNSQPSN